MLLMFGMADFAKPELSHEMSLANVVRSFSKRRYSANTSDACRKIGWYCD